ncbi:MAG: flagellar biosynthesis protein FlhA [Acidobacteria bacterium]|nr:flagellar biosynthesis protein FlhA [Acidobacteriota bacterium]
MAPAISKSRSANNSTDWIVPAGAVALVFVMLVPLPVLVLDVLFAVSITAGILVLLASLYILRPVQFSVFPTLLLLLTLFRLGLNIASSRRILLHGNEGASAAGSVIESFGQFVVGGNYVVGFVIFLALIAIQYLVINHGAVRIAEVTARFTLDALPGKQMAIDADLNAGQIDEHQAHERRREITREAEFYGAMDGAARFNQRDAVATILITLINIIAGFLIGVFQLDIPFEQALKTYTILTVGDGLATLIPSLLVSVAGGLVITRASSDTDIGTDLHKQLISTPRPLWIAASVMFLLALIPGLPKFPFFLMAGTVAIMAWRITDEPATEEKAAAAPGEAQPSAQEQLENLLKLDDLSLEVGFGLVPLVDQKQGGQLLQRIRALRRHLATQLGFIVPPIHITDNLRLKHQEYVIQLRGVEVARWEMERDCMLAISSEAEPPPIEGKDTHEPAFGASAKWIAPNLQEAALAAGCAVVDQTSVMATHLAEVVKQHAHELLTRSETKRLLDTLAETHPKLVEELVPKLLSLGEVQKVLQQLLREQVSIRDLSTILETLLDAAAVNRNPVLLVEAVRQALSRALVHPLLGDEGKLKLLTLNPAVEQQISQAFDPQASPDSSGRLQPSFLRNILENLRNLLGEQASMTSPVLLCSSPARFHLRRLLEPFLPRVVVLSPAEIPTLVSVQSMGMVG